MDTQQNFYTEFVKLVPIIFGGILAISGGIAGQLLTHRLSAQREKKTLLRSRLETIVKALYGHTQWLSDKYSAMVYRREDHDDPSPLDEAKMLQSLYFPELQTEIAAIMEAQQPMIKFIWEQRIARMRDEAVWLREFDRAPYDVAYRAYLLTISVATSKCRGLVDIHFGS